MGQKVSPIGFRTGVTIGWKSRWFAPKSNYGEFLVEDEKIRRFIDEQAQPPAAVRGRQRRRDRADARRSEGASCRTARPGLVIGPKGAEVDKLKAALEDLTNRRVSINIVEIKNPDLDAQLVAEGIAEQLKRRASFRRTMKQRAEAAMQAGAKGVKIIVSGRLGGAEMSRTETHDPGLDSAAHAGGGRGLRLRPELHDLRRDRREGVDLPRHVRRGAEREEQAAAAAMTRARRRRERRRRRRAAAAAAVADVAAVAARPAGRRGGAGAVSRLGGPAAAAGGPAGRAGRPRQAPAERRRAGPPSPKNRAGVVS